MRLLTIAATIGLAMTAQAFAEGDAAKGEKVFRKCAACHAVGEGAKNKVGPQLNGLIDRPAATVEGYKYSKAMKAKGEEGLVWSEDNLHAYLTKPKDFVPKTKMAFAGLRKEADIDNIIAYLKQYQ
ncbi:c-type cytochrome [Roseibium limicola]|uniref:Cytochrome c family protein n=1 Tax=Roseibium limicola TaxID=2816037 RepID=A0A939ENJ9_9HYPH|nr:cytochrome c family protein [Roseibium limicola]MBO0345824.1 cytochrome c family protein [Roseibium limicola]